MDTSSLPAHAGLQWPLVGVESVVSCDGPAAATASLETTDAFSAWDLLVGGRRIGAMPALAAPGAHNTSFPVPAGRHVLRAPHDSESFDGDPAGHPGPSR